MSSGRTINPMVALVYTRTMPYPGVPSAEVLASPGQADVTIPILEEARRGCLRASLVALALQGGAAFLAYSIWQALRWMK